MDAIDLADRVTAALRRSILPAVVARGGTVRVVGVEDGVANLEVHGSPGAVLPLASRIEGLLRAAVPEVTAVRIVSPGAQAAPAAHGRRVTLVGVDQGWVRIRLEGGCQGCSLAEVTVRQGIEPLLRARVPEMVGLAD